MVQIFFLVILFFFFFFFLIESHFQFFKRNDIFFYILHDSGYKIFILDSKSQYETPVQIISFVLDLV